MTRRVYMAMPLHDGRPEGRAAEAFYATASARANTHRVQRQLCNSLLPHAFNSLWSEALVMASRGEVDFFAMLHGDMAPDAGWLDTLIDELEANNAAMISAIVPIKNDTGLSSTAYCDPRTPWDYTRLTMSEVQRMPETFGNELIKDRDPNGVLLLNTGCCVMDMRLPCWLEADGDELFFRFEFITRIARRNKVLRAEVLPEDWLWSLRCQSRGLKIIATRKVAISHIGKKDFRNDRVWGAMRDTEREQADETIQRINEGCEAACS